jgi:polyketide biosynthesis acyl carrier protein
MSEPTPLPGAEEIFLVIRANLLEVLPVLDAAEVTMDSRMSDLGANSIDRMDVVVSVTQELGVEVAPQRLSLAHDIRSLVDVLLEEVACARQPG